MLYYGHISLKGGKDSMAAKTAVSSTSKSTVKATSAGYKSILSNCKSFCKKLKRTPIVGIMVAEFIGTFLLTAQFIITRGNPEYISYALIGVVLIIGGISGAHLNPAITIGAWVTRKVNSVYALGYVAAQVLGATSAWLALKTFLNSATTETTSTLFQAGTLPEGKEWYVFFVELLCAGILAMGIATAIRLKHDKTTAALTAGFGFFIAFCLASVLSWQVSGQDTSTSLIFLNPAIAGVSNALVLSAKEWALTLSIYIFAPAIGAAIGFFLHDFMQSQAEHEA